MYVLYTCLRSTVTVEIMMEIFDSWFANCRCVLSVGMVRTCQKYLKGSGCAPRAAGGFLIPHQGLGLGSGVTKITSF